MAKGKYSEALQDAYMAGDMETVASLKTLIAEEFKSKVEEPKKKSPYIIKSAVLNNDQSGAMKVNKFLVKAIGSAWFENEIETIDKLLWIEHAAVISDQNRDKIMALRHIQRSFNPYMLWFEFNQVALALGGAVADFEMLRRPSAGMLIAAVRIMEELKGDEDFTNEVIDYIVVCLHQEGIYVPPPTIASLIAESMKDSAKVVKPRDWIKVESMYNDGKSDETMCGVQAGRLYVAEAAATKYIQGV